MGTCTSYKYKEQTVTSQPPKTYSSSCVYYDCYPNCDSCSNGGSSSDMKCDSCPTNYIKYGSNCYEIRNEASKSFYDPHSNSLSSCFQKYGLYIKENEYECKTKPDNFFVLNPTTGVISSCSSECLTCSAKETLTSKNCITCLNDKLMEEGNCLSLCSKGYYQDDKNCIKCYPNCLSCNSGPIYDEINNKLISMGCIECANNYIRVDNEISHEIFCFPKIKYEETKITFDIKEIINLNSGVIEESCLYFNKAIFSHSNKCIIKPDNTYYILNDINENKGVIKTCDEACDSCFGPKELGNSNCISCANGYFKTEDSNTNCILKSSIPQNYYKNINDNIYYKCYFSCSECIKGYDIELNKMNCRNCIDGYYFINGTNNCYNMDILETNEYYFFNNIFYKCYYTCSKCSNFIPNKENHYCIKCNTSLELYFMENTYNCFNKTIMDDGYYLDNINPENKIFKKCYANCKTCNNAYINNDMNCILCKDGFYKLNGTNNCYNDTILDQGYYFNNEIFYPCYKTCSLCNASYEIDINTKEKKHNCKKCIDEYYFLFGTNNCYNESILEQGYYFFRNDSMYHKCDIQCKTCNNYSTNDEHNCILCNTESNYYKAENKSNTNCYNNDTIGNKYYLDIIYDLNINKYIKKWSLCFLSCESCLGSGNIYDHNCESCISDYYFIYGTKNCINKEYALSQSMYLDSNLNVFKKCDVACETCTNKYENNNTNCITCNTKEGYYSIYSFEGINVSNCYNNETIKQGYYLNNKQFPFIWDKCYERCKSCNIKGNITNMNCLSCKNDLINNRTNKVYYFKYSNGNCIETCPDNLLYTPIGDCVFNCTDGTYEFSLNKSCIETCPKNYEINIKRNKCILKTFDKNTNSSEFKNQIINDITSYVNSSAIINGSDFIAVVLSSENMDPKEQLKNGVSAIDLGNCTQDIKNYYNISNDENLIVLNMESKNDKTNNNEKESRDNSFNLGKNIQLEVFDSSGRKLDLSVCKEEIKVMKYIGDVEELNIQSAKDLSSQGIDIFNANDDFFNDICHQIDSQDGKDMILTDRRKDLYKNATFCQDGCTYSGMDYELMTANCICDSSFLNIEIKNDTYNDINEKKEEVNFKSITKSFISNLIDFNFDVLKCDNLVFNKNILINNIGFFCLLLMLFLQIIFLIIYMIKKVKPIKYYMLIFKENKIKKIPESQSKDNNSEKYKNKPIKKYTKYKYNKIKEEQYNDNYNVNNESNNQSSTGKKIFSDIELNLGNMLQSNDKSNKKFDLYNIKIKSKHKSKFMNDSKNKFFISNNFTPMINIQTQSININSQKKGYKQ